MNTLPLRRCVQLGVIALFCALPWLTAHDILFAQGTLFSFRIGDLSFADPAAALQAWPPQGQLSGRSRASLLLALFLGRVFCGWICPYGFLSELAYTLHQTVRGSAPAASPGRFARTRFAERLSRLLVLLLALLCIPAAGFPLLHFISMPGSISLSPLLVRIGAGFSGVSAALALPLLARGRGNAHRQTPVVPLRLPPVPASRGRRPAGLETAFRASCGMAQRGMHMPERKLLRGGHAQWVSSRARREALPAWTAPCAATASAPAPHEEAHCAGSGAEATTGEHGAACLFHRRGFFQSCAGQKPMNRPQERNAARRPAFS